MISIIVPTFNAGATLDVCLRSIQAQDRTDFEVIIVDGQSGDNTLAIAEAYAERLENMKIVSEPDSGIYDAMNKGVAIATQEWIYFLGADDSLANSKVLSRACESMSDGIDMLYGNVFRVSNGKIQGGRVDRSALMVGNICQQAIFYRKSMLNQVGSYNLDYRICSDWDLNIRCFAANNRQQYIDLLIARYSGTGISATQPDLVFLKRRLPSLARLYGVTYLNRLFRSARYIFLEDAHELRAEGMLLASARYYMIFTYHALLARLKR